MLTRETLAKTVRAALVESWKDNTLGGKWNEDILLTGCRAAKYADPDKAADNLALFVADAILALLPASPPADVAGMREACAEAADKVLRNCADEIGRIAHQLRQNDIQRGGLGDDYDRSILAKSNRATVEGLIERVTGAIRALPIPESKTDAEPEPIGWYVRCPETGGHLLDTEKIGAERKARECYHPREYHILPVFLSAPSKTDAAVKALVEDMAWLVSEIETEFKRNKWKAFPSSKENLERFERIKATLAANGVK